MIFVIAIANSWGVYFYIQDKKNLKHNFFGVFEKEL